MKWCRVPWIWGGLLNFSLVSDTGDYVTTLFLPMAIISCTVGLASVLAGVRHICLSRAESLASAAAASLIALVLDLVSLGLVTSCLKKFNCIFSHIAFLGLCDSWVHVHRFAVKEVVISGGYRPGRLVRSPSCPCGSNYQWIECISSDRITCVSHIIE